MWYNKSLLKANIVKTPPRNKKINQSAQPANKQQVIIITAALQWGKPAS